MLFTMGIVTLVLFGIGQFFITLQDDLESRNKEKELLVREVEHQKFVNSVINSNDSIKETREAKYLYSLIRQNQEILKKMNQEKNSPADGSNFQTTKITLAAIILASLSIFFSLVVTKLKYKPLGDNTKDSKSDDDSVILKTKSNANMVLLFNRYKMLENRINKEISRLTIFGIIHLIIGVIITGVALLVLYYTLIIITGRYDYTFLIPRLLLSLLIELFAFFFLRLYRSNFAEIKYYNNELTNIDMQFTSLMISKESSDINLQEILDYLTKTERNFVLKRGEHTVHFQQENSELESLKKMIETLSDTVKAFVTGKNELK